MRKQQGLSLIELMIATMLGLVLMAGVISMFVSSRNVFSTQQAMSRVQEAGRLSIEFMADEIRMAGYLGCSGQDDLLTSDLAPGFWTDFTAPSGTAGLNFFNAITGYTAADLLAAGLNPVPVPGTDALAVRYGGGLPHIIAEDVEIPGIVTVRAAGVIPAANCVNGICIGANLIVSNCAGGRVFTATNVGWDADITTISHAGAWPDGLVRADQNFFRGDTLQPVATVVYYIGLNPANRPSLYRRETGGPSVEMLEGVENMSLRYGIEAVYQPAAGIARWLDVESVSIELLMQGNEEGVLPEPMGYTFAGAVVPAPVDRRVRQVFRTTVAVRNRIN